MQLKFLLLSSLIIFSCTLIAQSVGINTASPDLSAALHIQSNKKGLLIPTMTATERNEIILPASGLLVYQADKISGFFFNSGTAERPDWKKLITDNLGLNGITGQTIRYNGDRWEENSHLFNNPINNYIGIGTTDPVSKLHVSGGFTGILNNDAGSAGNFQINNPVNNYSALYATTNGPGWAAAFEGGALVRGKGNTNATMGLRIENSFNQVKFAVMDGGNVSIGTPFALNLGGYSAVGSLANKRGLSIASTNDYKADAPAVLELSGSTDGVGEEIGMIEFVTYGDLNSIYNTARIAAVRESFNFTYTGLTFHTRIGSTLAERMRINSSGNVGIGCNAPQYKLHVVGDIAAQGGTLYAQSATINSTITACSDIRYKQNIHPLQSVLPALMQIQGVRYQFNVDAFPEKFFPSTDQIGFTAQEVEKFYPEIVVTDKEGYKSIDYTRFAPLLLEAIKEQQLLINEQKNEMKTMQEQFQAIAKEVQMLKVAVAKKSLKTSG